MLGDSVCDHCVGSVCSPWVVDICFISEFRSIPTPIVTVVLVASILLFVHFLVKKFLFLYLMPLAISYIFNTEDFVKECSCEFNVYSSPMCSWPYY